MMFCFPSNIIFLENIDAYQLFCDFWKFPFFAFPYLRASDFGRSLIFQKQFALNTALEVVLTTVLGLLVIALH